MALRETNSHSITLEINKMQQAYSQTTSHLEQSIHDNEAYYNFSSCDGHVEFLHNAVAAAKQNR